MRTEYAEGLTERQLQAAEGYYGFQFPPDLRSALASALPVGKRFPDWRDPESVLDRMNWPWEGIVFDLEHSDRWLTVWGPRPKSIREQLEIVRTWYQRIPRLIPIYGHRYLPATPCKAGNPILSVYQTDIIYYGMNLDYWLSGEFGIELGDPDPESGSESAENHIAEVEGWSEFM